MNESMDDERAIECWRRRRRRVPEMRRGRDHNQGDKRRETGQQHKTGTLKHSNEPIMIAMGLVKDCNGVTMKATQQEERTTHDCCMGRDSVWLICTKNEMESLKGNHIATG